MAAKYFKMLKRHRVHTSVSAELGAALANTLGLVLPLISIQVFDRIIPNNATETLLVLAVILVGAVAAEGALRIAVNGLRSTFEMRYELEAKRRLFESVLYAPAAELPPPGARGGLDAFETIGKVKRMNAGSQKLSIVDLPFAGLFLAMFWLIAPQLSVLLLVILAAVLILRSLGRKAVAQLSESRRDISARTGSFLFQLLAGIEHLKGLGAEAFMMRRHESLAARGAEATEALLRRQMSSRAFAESLAQATPMLIAMCGAPFVIGKTLTPGELAATVLLSGRVIKPFTQLQSAMAANRAMRPALEHLDQALAAPAVARPVLSPGQVEHLELAGLDVHSANGGTVCEGLNLTLQKGDTIAISGKSGSGKTTLLKTMLGQHPASAGRVLVNGDDISAFDPDRIAERFAFMQSAPPQVSGSVLDALTGMRGPDMLPQALELSRELGLAEFFALQPDDFLFKPVVGGDMGIPSAVRSQLAIVAAMIRQPQVLLFDEANALLDRQSDTKLLRALQRRQEEAIMVLATQRPSFAAIAGRHYRLENGSLERVETERRAEVPGHAVSAERSGAA